jgi:transcriptional regulator with GAF, ATPase, and Fis domain
MAKRSDDDSILASTASRQRPGKRVRPPASARLHVVHPPELVQQIDVPAGGSVAFGRARGDGVHALRHETVSRRHFELSWDSSLGAHAGRELGSRNGSFVDGNAVGEMPRPLPDGALVRLGDVLIVYELAKDVPRDPPEVSRDAIPGASVPMQRLRAQTARAATDLAPVLIVGATGVGKERIAGELHRLSGRKGRLVTVNCAALSPQLIESQLFGHVKGAFTGATESQPGLFVAADGGALFLDEIGELPLELQAKLLRAIAEGEVRAIGGTRSQSVDARVIAATNRDLAGAAESGSFRRDLYARLSLWELTVPSLRQRRADVLWWVARLGRDWQLERGTAAQEIQLDSDAAERLLQSPWSLNLRGILRLIRDLDGKGRIGVGDLPRWLDEGVATPATAAKKPIPTREELVAAHKELGGSVHALARHFDRDRRQIYRWLEQHGLRAKP